MPFPDFHELAQEITERMGIRKEILVEPYNYTTAKCSCRFRRGRYIVRISQFFADAPRKVIISLISTVVAKSLRKSPAAYNRPYRDYLTMEETMEKLNRYRSIHAGKVLRGEVGKNHDLGKSFRRVNDEYFSGKLHGITLSWGRASKRTLGHYDAAKRTVIVSALLDKANVPEYLVDFIVFHELLHHEFPTYYRNGRRVIHSHEFRVREKQFSRYTEARLRMKKLK